MDDSLPSGQAYAKSMVHPIFATLIFDGEFGLPKSIRRRCGDCSPRHDEIRA